MTLDVSTLFVVAVFILALGGLMLLFAWLQNRSITALAWWGSAFLLFAPAIALFGLRGAIADVWSIQVSNTFFLIGYGLMWTGARVFEGHKPLWPMALAGAGIWVLACQIDVFLQSLPARITLVSAAIVLYCVLFIRELWRGRREGLISRWPVMGLMGLHIAAFLIRIPTLSSLPFPAGSLPSNPAVAALTIFGPLFYAYALVFLLMALTKERAELNQRRAAMIDPLTGILNRRGFSERAERVAARASPDGAPLTLLLFDLDNFKSINDRFGHRVGDEVLVLFSQTMTRALRPLDLLGRIGGEEFVALLPGVSPDAAMDVAERIRDAFAVAARNVDGRPTAATVSIGTASAAQAGYEFDALYATADAALYRAKRKGRNRIELGLPVTDYAARVRDITSTAAASG